MTIYKRIMIAVDGEEVSKNAMKEAVKLTKDQDAHLYIIYIVDEFVPAAEGVPVDFKSHEAKLRIEGDKVLKKMSTLAKKAKIPFQIKLIEMTESESLTPTLIVEEAKNYKADLIILGTHGRTGISRLLLGSVAEEVTRTSPVPVVLIHKPSPKFSS